MEDTVLIIDDISTNRDLLAEMIPEGYEVIFGETGLDAVNLAIEHASRIALILLDLIMPKMDGFQALHLIKSNPVTKDLNIIIVTSATSPDNEVTALSEGATDFITKPFNAKVARTRIYSKLELTKNQRQMTELIMEKVNKIDAMQSVVIDLLANMVECREGDSANHIKHTRSLMKLFLDKILIEGKLEESLTTDELAFISKIVVLHDIGKITIPDNVLLKPDRLSIDEFEIIKTHTTKGWEITNQLTELQDAKYLKYVQDICLFHHEKWDGTGYPKGLKGKDIPFMARVTAIVDVYDAMMSKRVYKEAFTHEYTVEYMLRQRGKHFDPDLVDVFYKYNMEFDDLRD